MGIDFSGMLAQNRSSALHSVLAWLRVPSAAGNVRTSAAKNGWAGAGLMAGSRRLTGCYGRCVQNPA